MTGDELTSGRTLHPVLLHHIVNALGWSHLRDLQNTAVDPLVRGDDALLSNLEPRLERYSRTFGSSSWTKSTPSLATTVAGTCGHSWNSSETVA